MLNLQNILWVIPGVIFIHFFNKRRPNQTIDLSGWSYVFSVVVVAFFTWIPAEIILTADSIVKCLSTYSIAWIPIDEKIIKHIFTPILSIIFTFILLYFVANRRFIANYIFLLASDDFYKKCIELENQMILLTLKSGKAYIGILWKYPENPKSRHESQTISIVPFKSGYRDEKTKQVNWNVDYPKYEDPEHLLEMETIIPRSEIITFGQFSEKTHIYFAKNNEHVPVTSSNLDQDK